MFQREAAKLANVKWPRRARSIPDVIESAGAKDRQGAHHQVAPQRGRPAETLHLKLLEPLRELFKGRGARAGLELGLPRTMVIRHPFRAGPRRAHPGEVTRERADLSCAAPDAIFIDELRRRTMPTAKTWYDKTAQAFAVFLPVQIGRRDGRRRTYENAVALRAVQTTDFMTAHWAHLPLRLSARISNRITNEVRGFNRVVYDISSKPPVRPYWAGVRPKVGGQTEVP